MSSRDEDGTKKASLWAAFTSWRLGAVTLLSVSSGLPLGLLATAESAWLAQQHVDIKTIGLLQLTQLPWGFKFLWSPAMDRLRPPFFGHRRGWIFVCQLLLAAGTAGLGVLAADPTIGAVAGLSLLIAFAGASQDIAYDAYAVEVLERHEHGAAVGARSALYRTGMWLAGTIAISLAPLWSWKWTLIAQSLLYLALLPVTIFAPEPRLVHSPVKSFKDAVWQPFVGFLGRPRALEITAFVLLYRLADSVAGALVSPFLVQMGFSAYDIGVVRGFVGVAGTLLGTFLGGVLAGRVGVGRALWICGVLQIVSNCGYAIIAVLDPSIGAITLPWSHGDVGATINLPLQLAILVETACGGMGWGAFGVLLLRLTDKRFSATQYALFSSLVGLARTFVGPPSGVLADALGWAWFFVVSMAFGVPGMLMLRRFVPWGSEPKEISGDSLEPLPAGAPYERRTLWVRGGLAGLGAAATSLVLSGVMLATRHWRTGTGEAKRFDLLDSLHTVALPQALSEAVDVMSALSFGLVAALGVAALLAARGRREQKAL